MTASGDVRQAQERRRNQVQSVERALTILEVLGSTPDGLTLSEIARTIALSKSATLALLRTLAERDFVAQSNAGKGPRYRLGLSLARLGDEVLTQGGLLEPAIPILERLTRATGRTSRVGVLDNGYVVIIGRVNGPGFIQVQSHVGRREFAHCSALGKALLSRLPDEEIVKIVDRIGLPSRTQTTITGLDALLDDIRRARETGFALDDEEDNVGVFCIGAPVFDYRDTCVAAISITDIKIASDGVPLADLADSVLQHAKELSAALGAPAIVPSPLLLDERDRPAGRARAAADQQGEERKERTPNRQLAEPSKPLHVDHPL